VFEPELGLSSARNGGWRHARGSYVGYLDDDAIADRSWLESALFSFENVEPTPDWVGGPIELEWEVESPAWITEEHWVTLGYIHWGSEPRFLTDPAERLGGGNSFYTRSLLEDMNGFDTRLGRKKNLLLSGEETQFQHRLRARDGRLYYHPGVRIYHYVPEERTKPGFFYRRYYWGGITDYLMSKTLEGVSFEHIAQPESNGSRLGRLMGNSINALGMFRSQDDIIQSRIYLSYVAGQLAAIARFGWRRFELDQE
jgi:glycosyltransferase involved in cell wall biosynthesis